MHGILLEFAQQCQKPGVLGETTSKVKAKQPGTGEGYVSPCGSLLFHEPKGKVRPLCRADTRCKICSVRGEKNNNKKRVQVINFSTRMGERAAELQNKAALPDAPIN